MLPEPVPDRGPDEEPDDSLLPDEDRDSPEQGLFVCLPAEELTLEGFAEDGRADTMAPGPLLAAVVGTVTGDDARGLKGTSDDQLTGIISASLRLASQNAWTLLAALAEFASRRPASRDQGVRATGAPSHVPDGISVFAADELTGVLNRTWQSIAGELSYAKAVTERLPRTFAALGAGRIHPVHLQIIEDETRFLKPEDAARADEILAQQAPSLTFGKLRSAAHRLMLKLDPEAAQRRKEAARRETHIRAFREASGNAGLIAREMPSDEVLASLQHVEQRALDLRAAGLPGTLQELRVRAYLDLLQERDSRPAPTNTSTGADADTDTHLSAPAAPDPGASDPGAPDPGASAPCPNAASRPVPPDPGPGPSLAAQVTITVPLAALEGDPVACGEADVLGPVDAEDARALVAAAARNPKTRWCVTALHPDGTAAAHACATGRHCWSAGHSAAEFLRTLNLTLSPVIRGPCDHTQAQRRYRPSRALRHLVNARNTRCTAPSCGRPAARCDEDHTTPWHLGGLTCPCNIAPLCRHHHRCKQAEGWWLEQPEPGVLEWRAPSGRTFVTGPTVYSF
ncbi:MAG TPA: DUF222 domain-containing protein [Streptosporangiaceae bacterium]|nr:DUF222 domain-containing protein [Streptosporangiaceae bacterium]